MNESEQRAVRADAAGIDGQPLRGAGYLVNTGQNLQQEQTVDVADLPSMRNLPGRGATDRPQQIQHVDPSTRTAITENQQA